MRVGKQKYNRVDSDLNKIRKHCLSVNAIWVIFDGIDDFGGILFKLGPGKNTTLKFTLLVLIRVIYEGLENTILMNQINIEIYWREITK